VKGVKLILIWSLSEYLFCFLFYAKKHASAVSLPQQTPPPIQFTLTFLPQLLSYQFIHFCYITVIYHGFITQNPGFQSTNLPMRQDFLKKFFDHFFVWVEPSPPPYPSFH
jgi:hypothetical protein